MGNIFSGSELIELGIQIEKNGRDFYSTLAGNTKNQRPKEVFTYLSGEEEKHIAVFEKLLESVEEYEPPESYPGEYFAYMSALASSYVFTQKGKGREIALDVKGEMEAVDLGIGFEKDSIMFYMEMKKFIPDYDWKIADDLIDQEKSHLVKLMELRAAL